MKARQQQNDDSKQKDQASLSDIIASIRTMIDDKEQYTSERIISTKKPAPAPVKNSTPHIEEDDDVLELCEEYEVNDDSRNNQQLSDAARQEAKAQINHFAKIARESGPAYSVDNNKTNSDSANHDLDQFAENIMRPLLKSWLDSNMPQLVERVVREEIKQLIPKNK